MTSRLQAIRAAIDFAQPTPGQDGQTARQQWAFAQPLRELSAWQAQDIPALLDALEHATRHCGHWCVGWLAYEAATAFDPAFQTHPPQAGTPLAWFAVFEAPLSAEPQAALALGGSASPTSSAANSATKPAAPSAPPQIHWHRQPQRAPFEAQVARIKAGIGEGRYYQVNLTAPCEGTLQGQPRALFEAMQRAQPGGYAACIEAGEHAVLSVSPELFFDWQASADGSGVLLTRPMKGTAPRGATAEADAEQAQRLRSSIKERAENVMIVDLLRNDLSRVAQPFSVQVPRLFHLQPLPAVWQMTSDVVAKTRTGTHLRDVFGALFPCGSITGAPKVEAMRAIRELESGPRGVYCGAVGVIRPSENGGLHATFNVPIRTAEVQGTQLRASFGSGLVADADPAAEWAEWQHKRAFIDRVSEPFELLETLALVDGEFRHLPLHLARMQGGVQHFGFPWPEAELHAHLQELAAQHALGPWRVRLRLSAQGHVSAEAFALQATDTPVRLQLATRAFAQSASEFVRFKTTRRAHYNAFAPAAGSGVLDTILYNERGEITESTFGNLAMQLQSGEWVTPPMSCGLLAGIGRQVALQEGRLREQVVLLSDVLGETPKVKAWAFINSLRGWLPAKLVAGTKA